MAAGDILHFDTNVKECLFDICDKAYRLYEICFESYRKLEHIRLGRSRKVICLKKIDDFVHFNIFS